MAATYNTIPTLNGALWSGNQQLITKREFYSTINSLSTFTTVSSINASSITANVGRFSTLTTSSIVGDWGRFNRYLSTPQLFVSSINGAEFNQNQINISSVQGTQASFLQTILSSIQFNPSFNPGISPNFNLNLGLGDALAGVAAGFGVGVMGAAVAVPVVAGTVTYGLVQGINSIINPRTVNNINSNVYEQINYTSQLEVSTLGVDTTSVFRTLSTIPSTIVINPSGGTVSNINIEVFRSTIIPAGTSVIRTVADPIQLVSSPWTYYQAKSQWAPLPSGGGGGGITSTISTNFIVYNGGTTNGVGLTNNIAPTFSNLTWLYPVDTTFGYTTINGFTIGQGLQIINKATTAPGELIVQRIDFNSTPTPGIVNPMPCIQGDNTLGASINIEADVLQVQANNAIFKSTISLVPSTMIQSESSYAALNVKDSSSTIRYAQVRARSYTMRADDNIGTTEGQFVYQNLLDRPAFVDATLTTNTLAYLSEVPGPLTKLDQSLPINPNATLNGGTSPQTFLFPNAPGGPSVNLPTVAGGFYVIQSAYNINASVAGFPFRIYVVNGGNPTDATVIQDDTDPYVTGTGPLANAHIPFSVFFQAQSTSIQMAISAGTLPGGQSINVVLKPFYLWRIR
jgi:hypothetical protein